MIKSHTSLNTMNLNFYTSKKKYLILVWVLLIINEKNFPHLFIDHYSLFVKIIHSHTSFSTFHYSVLNVEQCVSELGRIVLYTVCQMLSLYHLKVEIILQNQYSTEFNKTCLHLLCTGLMLGTNMSNK